VNVSCQYCGAHKCTCNSILRKNKPASVASTFECRAFILDELDRSAGKHVRAWRDA
jgi:hypothetical protein